MRNTIGINLDKPEHSRKVGNEFVQQFVVFETASNKKYQ